MSDAWHFKCTNNSCREDCRAKQNSLLYTPSFFGKGRRRGLAPDFRIEAILFVALLFFSPPLAYGQKPSGPVVSANPTKKVHTDVRTSKIWWFGAARSRRTLVSATAVLMTRLSILTTQTWPPLGFWRYSQLAGIRQKPAKTSRM